VALREAAELVDARFLAVAHTLDDQAETVWLRVRRGTGPRGLVAMRELRPMAPGSPVLLWRPLLGERRADLRAFLRDRAIPFSEDATNEDRRFARNRARLDELPALEPALGADVVENLARLAAAAYTLDDAAERLLAERPVGGATRALRALPPGLRRAALARAYANAGGDPGNLTRRHLSRVLRVVDGRAVAASLPGSIEVRRSSGTLHFRPA
jgi:tRNA(Ile)-lysidine synthase